jgi:hypothetical protein
MAPNIPHLQNEPLEIPNFLKMFFANGETLLGVGLNIFLLSFLNPFAVARLKQKKNNESCNRHAYVIIN